MASASDSSEDSAADEISGAAKGSGTRTDPACSRVRARPSRRCARHRPRRGRRASPPAASARTPASAPSRRAATRRRCRQRAAASGPRERRNRARGAPARAFSWVARVEKKSAGGGRSIPIDFASAERKTVSSAVGKRCGSSRSVSERIPTGTPGSRARSCSALGLDALEPRRGARAGRGEHRPRDVGDDEHLGIGALVDRLRRLDDRLHRREPEQAGLRRRARPRGGGASAAAAGRGRGSCGRAAPAARGERVQRPARPASPRAQRRAVSGSGCPPSVAAADATLPGEHGPARRPGLGRSGAASRPRVGGAGSRGCGGASRSPRVELDRVLERADAAREDWVASWLSRAVAAHREHAEVVQLLRLPVRLALGASPAASPRAARPRSASSSGEVTATLARLHLREEGERLAMRNVVLSRREDGRRDARG